MVAFSGKVSPRSRRCRNILPSLQGSPHEQLLSLVELPLDEEPLADEPFAEEPFAEKPEEPFAFALSLVARIVCPPDIVDADCPDCWLLPTPHLLAASNKFVQFPSTNLISPPRHMVKGEWLHISTSRRDCPLRANLIPKSTFCSMPTSSERR